MAKTIKRRSISDLHGPSDAGPEPSLSGHWVNSMATDRAKRKLGDWGYRVLRRGLPGTLPTPLALSRSRIYEAIETQKTVGRGGTRDLHVQIYRFTGARMAAR
jgi:hypothetical protein